MLNFLNENAALTAFLAALFSGLLAIIINQYTISKARKNENYEYFYKIFVNKVGDLFFTLNAFRKGDVIKDWQDIRRELIMLLESNQHRLSPHSYRKYRNYITESYFENYKNGPLGHEYLEINLISEILNDFYNIYYDKAKMQMPLLCLIEIWSYLANKSEAHYEGLSELMNWHWAFEDEKLNQFLYLNLRSCKTNEDHLKFKEIIKSINRDIEPDILELFFDTPEYIIHREDSQAIGEYELIEHWLQQDRVDTEFHQRFRTRILEELYKIKYFKDFTYLDYFIVGSEHKSDQFQLVIEYLLGEELILLHDNQYSITSKGIRCIEEKNM